MGPIPDDRVLPDGGDPAELTVARESIRLAFVGALQHLPPRQRAVLILRDVLRWKATEVTGLLDATVASVNSALQRARATLATLDPFDSDPARSMNDAHRELLERYVDTFERYDIDAFVALLHEDAVQSMPPYAIWLRGPEDIGAWMLGPGIGCRDGRVLPVQVNGRLGLATYRRRESGTGHEPFSIHVWSSPATGSARSRCSSTPRVCSRCSGCRSSSMPDEPLERRSGPLTARPHRRLVTARSAGSPSVAS